MNTSRRRFLLSPAFGALIVVVSALSMAVLGVAQRADDSLEQYAKQLESNPKSSLAHYRIGEIQFLNKNLQSAANAFRRALLGDLEPGWTKVWSHINLGKIFDLTSQRERAILEYKQAQRTQDNTRGALQEAAKYLESPYSLPQK